MIRLGLPEAEILAWLVDHDHGTASEIGNACGIAEASVRGRLNYLARQKLIIRRASEVVPSLLAYMVTAEGRKVAS